MTTNDLKITFRKLRNQKFYALINVLGLATGVACCLLITLFVTDELRYDRFNEQADNIYRVASDFAFNGSEDIVVVSPAPSAKAYLEEIPEVINAARFRGYGDRQMRAEGSTQTYEQDNITWVDGSLFSIFSLPLLQGKPEGILENPNSLVLTESAAVKYFGSAEAAYGKSILVGDENYVVDGVCINVPRNSHFHYDVFMSLNSSDEALGTVWLSQNFHTYILAQPNHDPKKLEEKVIAVAEKYVDPQMRELAGASLEQFRGAGNRMEYFLQPLPDIHLKSNHSLEHQPNGDIAYVRIFSIVAIFILLLACINFMNMATARSAQRAKEVAMRKVLGSNRKNLVTQFLGESIMVSALAFGLGLGLAQLGLPLFEQLVDKEIYIPYGKPIFWGAMLVGALVVGLLAGSYPAFVLSGFEPKKVLKGGTHRGVGSGRLRQALVVSQFAISIALMIGTGVVYRQLNFVQNKRLGFDKDQVMILDLVGNNGGTEALVNSLRDLPQVEAVSTTCFLPINESGCRNKNSYWPADGGGIADGTSCTNLVVDHDYLRTYGIELLQGRFFAENRADSNAVVINQATVDRFNLEQPVGSFIEAYIDPTLQLTQRYEVIGVVENFHTESLHKAVTPVVMTYSGGVMGMIALRYRAEDGVDAFIDKVAGVWQQNGNDSELDYNFLDEDYASMYAAEQRMGNIFFTFAGLAIFIACLGLFALAAFTAERRTKEVSIRKVLGASVGGLVGLLSREFLILVVIALVIATPIAWYGMNQWLGNFSYRTEIHWSIFLLVGLLSLLIAFLTVGWQSLRTALANPIKSLRGE